jgi:CspA family cold shock protein
MAVGTLIWWHPGRGFGFIRPDEGGPDIFLHVSDLDEAGIHPVNLRIGQRLTFETGDHNGKKKATDVRPV